MPSPFGFASSFVPRGPMARNVANHLQCLLDMWFVAWGVRLVPSEREIRGSLVWLPKQERHVLGYPFRPDFDSIPECFSAEQHEPMDLKLKVTAGTNAGQEIKVPGPKYFIGRAEDCQLRPRSDLISRHHCVLIVEEKMAVVRDFGSKNGTHVNGERVGSERQLENGDILKVGPLEFEVKLTESVKKRPKINSIEEAAERAASTDFDMDSDVSQWLTDGVQAADTQEISKQNTEEVLIKPGAAPAPNVYVPPKAEPAPEEEPALAGKGSSEKKAPGKLPTAPVAKDSFSAAADMLRKMRKR
jgi:pSer/pThr/pTyr-binding forkhead associated (FHA) protein